MPLRVLFTDLGVPGVLGRGDGGSGMEVGKSWEWLQSALKRCSIEDRPSTDGSGDGGRGIRYGSKSRSETEPRPERGVEARASSSSRAAGRGERPLLNDGTRAGPVASRGACGDDGEGNGVSTSARGSSPKFDPSGIDRAGDDPPNLNASIRARSGATIERFLASHCCLIRSAAVSHVPSSASSDVGVTTGIRWSCSISCALRSLLGLRGGSRPRSRRAASRLSLLKADAMAGGGAGGERARSLVVIRRMRPRLFERGRDSGGGGGGGGGAGLEETDIGGKTKRKTVQQQKEPTRRGESWHRLGWLYQGHYEESQIALG